MILFSFKLTDWFLVLLFGKDGTFFQFWELFFLLELMCSGILKLTFRRGKIRPNL